MGVQAADSISGAILGDGLGGGERTQRRLRVSLGEAATRRQVRSLSTTTGGGAVGTIQVDESAFIEGARSRSIAGLLGARFTSYGGGRGKVTIPRATAGAVASWVAEDSAPATGTNPTLDKVLLDPKQLAAYVIVTREMLASAGPVLDALILADIAGALGAAVDAAAFNGQGGDQPTGILANGDVPILAIGANGGDPTRAMLISAAKTVALANGGATATASLGWATSPDGEAKLRSVDGSTGGAGRWLWDGDRILDRPAFSSTSLPNDLAKGSGAGLSPLIYGDFDALVVNLPETFDVVVDLYTAAPDVRVTAFFDVAIAVRRGSAFVKVLDLKTTP